MRQATIRSVCECQTRLECTLDEKRFVLTAWAIDATGNRERSPAHSIGAERPRFDVAWLCPVCGRNTLRSFAAEALVWKEITSPDGASVPQAKAG